MGCDAPPLCPDGCLCRGLRVLSELRITLIALMGCDAPRRFVPMVVCIGDCACCLNRAPWPPGALTLALSRRAGEGTVVVGGGGLFEPRIGVIFADGL